MDSQRMLINYDAFSTSGECITEVEANELRASPDKLMQWAYALSAHGSPLDIQERKLASENAMMIEFLAGEAALAFGVPANKIVPMATIGRVVMVLYEPRRSPDPIVPLMCLFQLSAETINIHNGAVRQMLENQKQIEISHAIHAVLGESVQAQMSREEVFAYVARMRTLKGGMYLPQGGLNV